MVKYSLNQKTTLSKLISIVGPTASGKTGWAIKLAQKFNGEIVSADSLQLYRQLDIGTAKPTVAEQNQITHHLINIINPNEEITVTEYKDLAITTISKIHSCGHLPLLVGGTGLYNQAVLDNLDIPRAAPDNTFRKNLETRLTNQELDTSKLYQLLLSKDPDAVKFIEPHNSRRIIRALEVIYITGRKLSDIRTKGKPLYNSLKFGISIPLETLELKFKKRTKLMLQNGLVEEVKSIINTFGLVKPMGAIGYKETVQYLENQISKERLEELINLHSLQYAKRQMKWFKRDKQITWLEDYQKLEIKTKAFLN